jgi:hypothetical protein
VERPRSVPRLVKIPTPLIVCLLYMIPLFFSPLGYLQNSMVHRVNVFYELKFSSLAKKRRSCFMFITVMNEIFWFLFTIGR